VSWSEHLLFMADRLLPRKHSPAASCPDGYSGAQYNWARGDLDLYDGAFELKDKVVLDAGCGPGGKTVYYAELGVKRMVGVDRSPDNIAQAIEFAKKRRVVNVEFRTGSIDSLPFESGTFDLAMMSDVFEHIERRLLSPALHELARVLKPGGQLALYFPPWTSFDASHLYYQIRIPWCQLLLSEKTLFNLLKRTSPGTDLTAAIAHFHELNRVTIQEFRALVREAPFRVEHFRLKTVKSLPTTGILKIDQYLTKRVVAVLAKV
jgi:SAM-dependent methyltransferase